MINDQIQMSGHHWVVEQLEFVWNLRFGHWDLVQDVCFQIEYLNSDRFEFIQSFRNLIFLIPSPLSLFKRIPNFFPILL